MRGWKGEGKGLTEERATTQPTVENVFVAKIRSTPPLQGNGTQGSDIILLKDQSTPSQNGLYWVNTSGVQVRCSEPLIPGRAIIIGGEGAVNGHAQYVIPQQRNLVQLGTTGLTFSRQNVVNVQDFGATGNGTTDDTNAIQAACSAFVTNAAANTANALYFPAVTLSGSGTYQTATLGSGATGSGGVGAQSGAVVGTYNGQRYNQLRDVVGSGGSQSAWYVGNAATPTASNWKLLATDAILELQASTALYFLVGSSPVTALQISTQNILIGLPLIGNGGVAGLVQAQTKIACTANVDTTSAGTGQCQYPQFVLTGTVPSGGVQIKVPTAPGTWTIVTSALTLSGSTVTFTDGTHTTTLSSTNIRPVMRLVATTSGTGFAGLSLG